MYYDNSGPRLPGTAQTTGSSATRQQGNEIPQHPNQSTNPGSGASTDEVFSDFSHDLVVTVSQQGTFLAANAPAVATLGLQASDFRKRNFREWLALNSIEEWETCLEAAAAGVSVNGANITLTTPHDASLMMEVNFQPLPERVVVYLRSLNEEQRVRQALRGSEERLRNVLTALPDLVLVLDREGRYRQIYTGDKDVLLAPAEDMLGKHMTDFVSDEESELGLRRIAEVIDTQQTADFEYQLNIKGEEKWFLAKVVPFGEHDPRVIWVSRDVSSFVESRLQKERDQQLLRDLLELEQKARDVIAYEIHDGFVQYGVGSQMWLQSGMEHVQNEEAKDALKIALESIEQAIVDARAMIRELRPVGSSDAGDLKQDLELLINSASNRSKIVFSLDCKQKPPRLLPLLHTQVIRIVQESLNNVIRHSNATQAQITLAFDDANVRVTVEDDGDGFDPENIPSGHFGIEGILRRAKVFGGNGDLQSQPGKGTRIEVLFPLIKPDSAERNLAAPDGSSG